MGTGNSGRKLGKCGRRIGAGMGTTGLVLAAFGVGRCLGIPQAEAQTPATKPAAQVQPANVTPSEAAQRWVAVIYGNIPVTREDFGEYLIARHSDKLELLVNKKIIEHACRQRNIEVTDAEVEAVLADELRTMQVSLKDFVEKVLKKYNKTLFEWKEDVIKPRLAMNKMCANRIQITEEDYRKAFEAYYGEKIEPRIIMFPKGEDKQALQIYGELRKSDEDFDRIAKQQASATLAATGGRIQPMGRHTTGNDELEKEAFSLQPGEISRLIATPEGTVVLKCVRRIPADTSKRYENEKHNLDKEIRDKKTQLELPKLFKELQEQAQPKLFVKRPTLQEDLEREVKKELQSGGIVPAGAVIPKAPNR